MKKIDRGGIYEPIPFDACSSDYVRVKKVDLDKLEQHMKELLDINIIILKGGQTMDDTLLASKRIRAVVCKCMNKTWEQIKAGKG